MIELYRANNKFDVKNRHRNVYAYREFLLGNKDEGRLDCDFEEIQRFVQTDTAHRIPNELVQFFAVMEKWQLVVPDDFDERLIFLGRRVATAENILLQEAQATIYIEAGFTKCGPLPYGIGGIDLATIMPDSNGDKRIVGIHYLCCTNQTTKVNNGRGRMDATHVDVSLKEEEYTRLPTPFDSFLPPIVDIPREVFNHPMPILTVPVGAIMTQAMIDELPEPHRQALSVSPSNRLQLIKIGGRGDENMDFDQGVSLYIEEGHIKLGLLKPLGDNRPWHITIPETLTKNRFISSPDDIKI
ncbi:MAG: hypothetical protein G01um10147_849 [Microgenomates group bacterium Gr01-1014_7]|nr:MAG: hypothetical protein G01um10147_849 [Microgenomates group bacterium Gr01-1014_7]